MAKSIEQPSSVTKRLAAEHRHLSRATQQLRVLARGPVTDEGLAFWRQDLGSRLATLRNLLLDHFEHEEQGGFLRDVLKEVPNSQRQVAALRREHDDIELRLDRILAELDELETTRGVESIQSQIAVLIEILVEHETGEQHLVQRTYYREYGAGD